MNKKIVFALLAVILNTYAFAQKPEIKFTETTYDFGTISEEDGKVSHIFEFTNSGAVDLVLKNVQASCGCTTPQWVREPVAPKQKGTITVTYTTAGRPGPFTKTITVSSNADKVVLTIKGVVTPRGQKVEDAYPLLKGDVRIKTETINFGDIAKGETGKAILSIANVSKKDALITFIDNPAFINADTKSIKPDEKGNISLTFNTALFKEWGRIQKDIYFITGSIKDKKATKHKITVTANIFERFTEQQIANAPTLQIANEIVAGEVEKGKTKTVIATFKNTGKSTLYVRNMKAAGSSIKIKSYTKEVAVGKEGEIKLTIDASKLSSQDYRETISLMVNDPQNVNKNFVLSYKVK